MKSTKTLIKHCSLIALMLAAITLTGCGNVALDVGTEKPTGIDGNWTNSTFKNEHCHISGNTFRYKWNPFGNDIVEIKGTIIGDKNSTSFYVKITYIYSNSNSRKNDYPIDSYVLITVKTLTDNEFQFKISDRGYSTIDGIDTTKNDPSLIFVRS